MTTGLEDALRETSYRLPVNIGQNERLVSIAGGALLLGASLKRLGVAGTLGLVAGGALLARGLTGHCSGYAALGIAKSASTPTAFGLRPSMGTVGAANCSEAAVCPDAPDLVDETSMASFPASDPPAYPSRQ